MVGEELKEVEPPLHQSLESHKGVLHHMRDFPQPDIITKVHFQAHNNWQKIRKKIQADHPTVSIHGRHPVGKGLIVRATPARAQGLSKSLQRRVEYLGSYTNTEGRHQTGHYWQVYPTRIGTRIVGNGPDNPSSNPKRAGVHPKMLKRAEDVFADKLGRTIAAAVQKKAEGPKLSVVKGGRADEMIQDRLSRR